MKNLITKIDSETASLIIAKLGFNLQDLEAEYGNVVCDEDISHQLIYKSEHNSCVIAGYVWYENGIYYTSSGNANFNTPQQAALELLKDSDVIECWYKIKTNEQICSVNFIPEYAEVG